MTHVNQWIAGLLQLKHNTAICIEDNAVAWPRHRNYGLIPGTGIPGSYFESGNPVTGNNETRNRFWAKKIPVSRFQQNQGIYIKPGTHRIPVEAPRLPPAHLPLDLRVQFHVDGELRWFVALVAGVAHKMVAEDLHATQWVGGQLCRNQQWIVQCPSSARASAKMVI